MCISPVTVNALNGLTFEQSNEQRNSFANKALNLILAENTFVPGEDR